MAGQTPAPAAPAETIFDRAIAVNAFVPRGDGESLTDYADRDDWGPNTRAQVALAVEHAFGLDQQLTTNAIASARDHHDDPNPPDTKPRKK